MLSGHPLRAFSGLLAAAIVLTLGASSAAGAQAHPAGNHASAAAAGRALPKTKTPTNGQTVSGRINWRVAVRGAKPKRVLLSVDGGVAKRYRGRRRTKATIDTTKLSNGAHHLTAIAYGPNGRRSGKSKVKVVVENPVSQPNGPNSVYWGGWIGDQLTGTQAPWDMSAVSKFEQMAGKQASLVQFGSPFADCSSGTCSYYNFPLTPFNDIRAHGSIPFLSWSSQGLPGTLNQPNFQLSDVANGTYDSYIKSFATAAKNWGHPFFLRFNWEMNGDWFPWSEGVNGNPTGEYVAAWRHVHDIFTSVGATNASWVWCPMVDPGNKLQNLSSLYPGDSYVDWTCLDGYNWGTNPARPQGWKSFDQLFSSTYHQITDTIAPSKPMAIGEFGSSEFGGSKAAWIQDALSKIPSSYPKVRAASYFERYDDGMDWPLETSPAATSAFASGIQNPAYASNSYANIAGGAIPAPSG